MRKSLLRLLLVVAACAALTGFALVSFCRSETAAADAKTTPTPAVAGSASGDLGLADAGNPPRPKSEWIEAEKATYRALLKQKTPAFDALVVPFQVKGYAIDRPGRSLMTRYLSRVIENSGLSVPDPGLVDKALGSGYRSFDEAEVYKLANELGVKTLVMGFAGHYREEKMTIEIKIQARGGASSIGPLTGASSHVWRDVPFSDEHPPSQTFRDILGEAASNLPFKAREKRAPVAYKRENLAELPGRVLDIFTGAGRTPVLNAFYLQLTGMLHPGKAIEKEYLFERSLVALEDVSPESPDYRILKARALFYLHRRPAAIAALGKANGPEEQALMAVLNGNAVELQKQYARIERPLVRLLTYIELSDLRYGYRIKKDDDETKKLVQLYPAIALELFGTLHADDEWTVQSNITVKKRLDETFPVEGFTADGIIKTLAAKGDLSGSGDEVDFSVYSHRKRLFEAEARRLCCASAATSLVEMDYLDLLSAMGEHNLQKAVYFLNAVQSLPEEALDKSNRFDVIYRGHPEFTYRRGVVIKNLMASKQAEVREKYMNELETLAYNAFYWSQGQTVSSQKAKFLLVNFKSTKIPWENFDIYDGDYPVRGFWQIRPAHARKKLKGGILERLKVPQSNPDIQLLEVSLLYGHANPAPLMTLFGKLIELNASEEAERLLKSNKHRFAGSPAFARFIADKLAKGDDISAAKRSIEKAIEDNPNTPGLYIKLAGLYLSEGNPKKALEVYRRLPGLDDKNGETVWLANYTEMAALNLARTGAIDEAVPLFKLSAGFNTGAMSEMVSEFYLRIFKGDYPGAAAWARDMATRYKSYQRYLDFLHLFGFHDEARAILDSLDITRHSDTLDAAMVGYRIQGWSEAEMRKWLKGKIAGIARGDGERHILLTHTIDRKPDPGLIWFLEAKSTIDLTNEPVRLNNHRAWFAQGYYHLKSKEYHAAYGVFEQKFALFLPNFQVYRYSIPYVAWGSVKASKTAEFETILDNYRKKFGKDFNYHLSMAFLSGAAKKHPAAIEHLNKARFNIVSYAGSNELFPWYQLLEAAEWLYEDTGHEGYRDVILSFSKTHQRVYPMHSWAYAFEAKHAADTVNRLRALAMALYLDRNSERISGFSEKDKKEAREWFEKNSPFGKKSWNEGEWTEGAADRNRYGLETPSRPASAQLPIDMPVEFDNV